MTTKDSPGHCAACKVGRRPHPTEAYGRLDEYCAFARTEEESVMPFTASPQQVKILKQAVDDYCRDCGINNGEQRLYVAEVVSSLFDHGAISLNDLRRGLEDAIGKPRREA